MTEPFHDREVSRTPGPDRMLWGRSEVGWVWMDRCQKCEGRGTLVTMIPSDCSRNARSLSKHNREHCEPCHGLGWLGINPAVPTIAPPGSAEKQIVILVRYHAGLPFFIPGDADFEAFSNPELTEIPYEFTVLKGANQEQMPPPGPFIEDDLDEEF